MKKQTFIPEKRIENEAAYALAEYERKYKCKITAPVPIEELLDGVYDIKALADDLSIEFPGGDTLAAFMVGEAEKYVRIDHSIHPDTHPEQMRRYRFTLGHEAGHWMLHRDELLANLGGDGLFGPITPLVVCRSSNREPKEIQADIFAGYVLMPKNLVLEHWESKFGNDFPVNVYEEIRDMAMRLRIDPREVRCGLAKEFAGIFEVSAQAMQIRLSNMGLLQLEEAEPSLF